eukprot:CAMPEP_0174266078 /NCGR_PEP_ID=MMETSP0439-20130205/28853_1 /TAXON_ID=0 /ORGANISM="Stereomyxa ramosa, Strain Chinc5" /LENGTH=814 /DNA_ID=CAMNT_0015352839 /DNA_START=40 /DNA_END=2481 /DNA_ORIENTATION=+
MDFASSFTFVKPETTESSDSIDLEDGCTADYEVIGEDELGEGLRTNTRRSKYTTTSLNTVAFRRMDTNVLKIDLSTLANEAPCTGDPFFCSSCGAALSAFSKVAGHENTCDEEEKDSDETDTKEEQEDVDTPEVKQPEEIEIEITEADPETKEELEKKDFLNTEKQSELEKGDTEKGMIEEQENEDGMWVCEFCGNSQLVTLDEEEFPIPGVDTVDYLLASSPMIAEDEEDSNVVFCIDTSGSMGVTTEVKGKVELRGVKDKLAALQKELNPEGERQVRYGRRYTNVTYISRMQCAQAAVDQQLEQISKESPNRRVGVVAFSNEISIIGDGVQATRNIAGDKLNDYEQLLQEASSFTLDKPISEAREALSKKVFDLEESGATALGPALLCSVAIAAQKPGSKVVLCTDGLANIGLGSLEEELEVLDATVLSAVADETENIEDNESPSEDLFSARLFFQKVADYAKENGVVISVISIKGTTCSMENLGVLAEQTSGQVQMVDPLQLTKNFHSILATPVVAVNVKAKMILHESMVMNEVVDGVEVEQTELEKDVGIATTGTSLTFDYHVKNPKLLDKNIKYLPFQVQISFTRLNGMRMVRVITKRQRITRDRAVAEKKVNQEILGINTVRKAAQYARHGDYETARLYTYSNSRLMNRTSTTSQQRSTLRTWTAKTEHMDRQLRDCQTREVSEGRKYSTFGSISSGNRREASEKCSYRSHTRNRDDETSTLLFQYSAAGNDYLNSKANSDSDTESSDTEESSDSESDYSSVFDFGSEPSAFGTIVPVVQDVVGDDSSLEITVTQPPCSENNGSLVEK